MMTIYTIGHSTRSLEEFIAILKAYDIGQLVDVRTVPRSRHVPHFNADTLPEALAKENIAHYLIPELGGLRPHKRDSENAGWRNKSFQGYADHMQTPEFEKGLRELISLSEKKTVAIMCAEAVPWRCHRSLVGDALLVRGVEVVDIFDLKNAKPEKLTSFAQVEGEKITYPPLDESE